MASLALALISLSALVAGARGECCTKTTILYTLPEGVGSCSQHELKRLPSSKIDPNGIIIFGDLAPIMARDNDYCRIDVCNDGSWHEGPHCGRGPCNIFGCNCDGGCFGGSKGNAYKKFKLEYGHGVKRAWVE